MARALARVTPGFAWRWGLRSAYGWEQFSFWWHLWPHLRRGGFDILHVQDPMLAWWCRAFRRAGWVRAREILAHGTEEPPEFIRQFEFVQHLAPWHLEQARSALALDAVSGFRFQVSGKKGQDVDGGGEENVESQRGEDSLPKAMNATKQAEGRGIEQSGDSPSTFNLQPSTFPPEADPPPAGNGQGPGILEDRESAIRQPVPSSSSARSSNHPTVQSSSSIWFAIPNFVDVERFKPDPDGRRAIRTGLGIPEDAFVAIAVGALKREHKRVDWLIREFAAFAAAEEENEKEETSQKTTKGTKEEGDSPSTFLPSVALGAEGGHLPPSTPPPRHAGTPILLLVGATTPDTAGLAAEAREAAGDSIRFLPDQPREAMPGLLAAADVFVHAALFEMMPIAFLEAIATGLPVVSHGHPVMQWIAGSETGNGKRETRNAETGCIGGRTGNCEKEQPTSKRLLGGCAVDMTEPGAMAEALRHLSESAETRRRLGRQARQRAEQYFTKSVIVGQYVDMYERVLCDETAASVYSEEIASRQ